MPEDLKLDDTVEFNPWDDDDLSGLRVVPREERLAVRIRDQAAFSRIQERSVIAIVDAWVMAAVIGPNEPVPYYLTPKGGAVRGA